MILLFILMSSILTKGEDLVLLAKTHTTPLAKYVRYIDSVILHFQIPLDTSFACFKFETEEIQLSIFSCPAHDITVHLKHGSLPVINPDGAKTTKEYFNESRPLRSIEFKSLGSANYINISSPFSGSYYATAFISYTDPRLEAITQQGLTPNCETVLTASLLVNRKLKPITVVPDVETDVLLESNSTRVYKFHILDVADRTILFLKNIDFCDSCLGLTIKLSQNRIPQNEVLQEAYLKKGDYANRSFMFRFTTVEESRYYVSFKMDSNSIIRSTSQFQFKVSQFFHEDNNTGEYLNTSRTARDITYKYSVLRDYQSQYLNNFFDFKQYDLIRSSRTESFMYSFDFHAENDAMPIPINITNKDLIILKFYVTSEIDVGGTLQFGLAFKPRVKKEGKIVTIIDEPKNHTLVACLKNNEKQIPTWPNKCIYHGIESKSALILNDTIRNSTLFLPYPESGNWYASLKLFCGGCKPCTCSESCKKLYKNCHRECESNCETAESCSLCIDGCEKSIITKKECGDCDCEGPCVKSSVSCNSSILFEISSYPCVNGQCGANGKCVYMIAQGFSYSVCLCVNKYKGWDCSDNSAAHSSDMVLLELLLLVLSNLAFLPAVYLAYKRRYYVESVVYFSTLFFSSFYHACDAGENLYTFCITRISVLQFSDFFCGLLSIWVTIIAIAHLPQPLPSILHISGAIVLAFITSNNKTALWAFVIPFATGILILVISWYRHYKKYGKRLPFKRYLTRNFPAGITVVAVGLLIYCLLQTQSNYMYLHSVWHICMAISIVFLLPTKQFLPAADLNGSQNEQITEAEN